MRYVIVIFSLLYSVTVMAQDSPEGRVSAKFIYHHKSKSLLLVDGYQIHPDSTSNPVWKWNGKNWTKIDAFGPGSRSLSAADEDRKNNAIVVYGGVGKTNYDDKKSDVWSFDGKSWTQLNVNDIGSRDHHQMAYADHLNAFIMYGGLNAKRDHDSLTWILKDGRFTSMDIEGPGSRHHFGMCYDPIRKKIVLFGGATKSRRTVNEIWEFDGKKWERITPQQNIAPRLWHSMVYNEDLKMILVHGGRVISEEPNAAGETWGWDGKKWTIVAQDGPQGLLMALGYDPERKVTVAFGGTGDTMTSALWELKNGTWKKVIAGKEWKWVDNSGYVLIENKN